MAETDSRVAVGEPEPKQPGLRFLEAVVYIMGGLLVLMLLGLLGGIAWKVTHRTPVGPVTQAVDVAVPEGSAVAGVTLDGDRMAVHVMKGADHEIIVVDTRKGTILSRVRLKPGAAARQ
jgi:hypothetical protein